jgi:hypothetical protein
LIVYLAQLWVVPRNVLKRATWSWLSLVTTSVDNRIWKSKYNSLEIQKQQLSTTKEQDVKFYRRTSIIGVPHVIVLGFKLVSQVFSSILSFKLQNGKHFHSLKKNSVSYRSLKLQPHDTLISWVTNVRHWHKWSKRLIFII